MWPCGGDTGRSAPSWLLRTGQRQAGACGTYSPVPGSAGGTASGPGVPSCVGDGGSMRWNISGVRFCGDTRGAGVMARVVRGWDAGTQGGDRAGTVRDGMRIWGGDGDTGGTWEGNRAGMETLEGCLGLGTGRQDGAGTLGDGDGDTGETWEGARAGMGMPEVAEEGTELE